MVNLAEPRLGSKVIFKTDDFFASAHRILKSESPVFKEGLFDKYKVCKLQDYKCKEILTCSKCEASFKPDEQFLKEQKRKIKDG